MTPDAIASRYIRTGVPRRVTFLSVLLSLLMLAGLLPGQVVVAEDALDADTALLSDAEADALIADIESQAAAATVALEDLRSDRLHPEVVIEATGTDPSDILDWVAQETR